MTPIFTVKATGKDITDSIADRLISLRVTDEAGIKSDIARLQIDNRDLKVPTPPSGTELEIYIGYRETGLVLMGLYKVSEIEISGSPIMLDIQASAADFKRSFKARKTRGWDGVTVADLVATIAAEHGYQPLVSPALAAIEFPHLDQTEESDMHLLTRLAGDLDAIMKPTNGFLYFKPRAEGKTARGRTWPPVVVAGTEFMTWSYLSVDRGKYAAVEARWRDVPGNRDVTVSVGTGMPVYKLRNSYPDADAARSAAKAKSEALERGSAELRLELPGLPAAKAEAPLRVTGLHPEVDGAPWTITRAEHEIGSSGYRTRIDAEAKKK